MTDWIETYTGKKFYFNNILEDSIDICDIAHALSLLCRFCGHSYRFYSIGDHSIRVSGLVPVEDKLAALMHDSAEAYINDMSRPLKRSFPQIEIVENNIRKAIFSKFGINKYNESAVKKADDIMLATEAKHLGFKRSDWNLSELPLDRFEKIYNSDIVEWEFLKFFYLYSNFKNPKNT